MNGQTSLFPADPAASTYQAARLDFERELFVQALRRYHGNVSAAARQLGMSRRNLHLKLNRLNIDVSALRAE
jgi:DNA-binding NtrC family response regulator